MAKVIVDMPITSIKELLSQLTPQELMAVFGGMQDRFESLQMTKLAESAFREWNDEEDLYGIA